MKLSFVFLTVGGVLGSFYSYLLSFTDRGLPFTDAFNLTINAAWLCVLIWIGVGLYRRSASTSRLLLFVALFIAAHTLTDVFDDDVTPLMILVSSVEAAVLFASYHFSER